MYACVRVSAGGMCARLFRLVVGLTVVGVIFSAFMTQWCQRNPYHDYCDVYDDVSEQVGQVVGKSAEFASEAFHRVHNFVTEYLEGDSSYW